MRSIGFIFVLFCSKLFSQAFTVGDQSHSYHLVNVTFTSAPWYYNNEYDIDFDGNPGVDIAIIGGLTTYATQHHYSYTSVTSTNQCEFAYGSVNNTGPVNCPYTFTIQSCSYGDPINSSMNWSVTSSNPSYGGSAPYTYYNYWNNGPQFNCNSNTSAFYVCFRKILASNDTIYGWINLQGGVKEYAYTNTGNPAETGLSVNAINKADLNICPNPNSGKFKMQLTGISSVVELKVLDIRGELIKTVIAKKEEEVDVSELSNGIYFLRGNIGNSVVNKKIIVLK